MTPFNLLCAGAVQGLVNAQRARWQAETGTEIQGRFGAVGAMKEALLAGEPCDVLIVTDAMITKLAAEGRVRATMRSPIGRVRTGIAVKSGRPRPAVDTPAALRAALLGADAIYFPDALRSTAGIHFAHVMQGLGLFETLQPRWRTFPNGATAMRELAAAESACPLGCTQLSEILYTPGVDLVGALPAQFELATVYTAAVGASAADPALAERFIALLAGPASQELRARGGFEEC